MKANRFVLAAAAFAITLTFSMPVIEAHSGIVGSGKIKHVVLLSIDGMHAVDFYNCANGIPGANGGQPYCPNMAALSQTGVNYVNTESSKPSDLSRNGGSSVRRYAQNHRALLRCRL